MAARKDSKQKEGAARFHINAYVWFILLVLLYLLITFGLFCASDSVTAYEVKTGTLSKTTVYTGLLLRSENVVYTQEAGSVTYCLPEASRVKAGSTVCVTSFTKEAQNALLAAAVPEETVQEDTGVLDALVSFRQSFSPEAMDAAYSFHEQLNSLLLDEQHQGAVAAYEAFAAQDPAAYRLLSSPVDGIISYHVDGLENAQAESLSPSLLESGGAEEEDLRNTPDKQNGDPVYKVITSERWSIVLPLDEDAAAYITENEVTEAQVRVHKDNALLTGSLSMLTLDGESAACLTFTSGMIRYISERYLDVTLILENESGLKIPQSAVTEKTFTLIPKTYITQGGEDGGNGVLLQAEGASSPVFTAVEIYKEDTEEGTVYMDAAVIAQGDVLVHPDSGKSYTVDETAKLEGVYSVNKGYAVFKQIDILTENSEYCIVKEGTGYGIANHDYIALNADSVNEDDFV